MRKIVLLIALLITFIATSQVGINTTTPQSILDITVLDPSNPVNTDGLLIPRLDTFPVINPTAAQLGQLIYLRTPLTAFTVDTVAKDYSVGFYYWDNANTDWILMGVDDAGWKKNGNANNIAGTHFFGTLDNQEIDFRVNNSKIADFTAKGQFGLNSGGQSVFIGLNAGDADDGSLNSNVAVGYHSLLANTTGEANTAVGSESLRSNTTGNRNTGIGQDALEVNTIGNNNTALGYDALEDNTTGNNNTAVGMDALTKNTTGDDNVAIGQNAMFVSTTSRETVAVGEGSLLNLTTAEGNTAIGADTGINVTTGVNNVIVGRQSGQNITTGSHNITIGFEANLSNATRSFAAAIGYRALAGGEQSIALGYNSQSAGRESIAIGANTIASNEDSVAIGDDAESRSNEAIAIGNNTVVISSNGSTAMGHENSIDGGSENSLALGYRNTITGGADDVTVVGKNSIASNGATNSLIFGNNSILRGGTSNSVALGNNIIIENGYTNTAGVGFQASPTQSNQIRLGNTAITNIMGQVAITTTSDKRFKSNVQKDISGLAFINRLTPVSYTFDKVKLSQYLGEKEIAQNTNERIVGFMAQDVEHIANEIGFDFSGIKKPEHEGDIYGLSYASFVVPLVKAIQEQQEEIESLKIQIKEYNALKAEIDTLKKALHIK